jgi:hypothetical protein
MKTAKPYLLLLPILAFLLSCCEEEPEPDPCASLEPVTARFVIGERIMNWGYEEIDTLVISDTVLTWSYVQFRAPAGYDSYEWQVGTEEEGMKTYSGDSVVQIQIVHPWEALPVSLIVRDEPNTACFPQDDGIDTLTRILTVIDRDKSPAFGRYQGYLESNPTDTFTVSFNIKFNQGEREIDLLNMDPGCYPTTNSIDYAIGYRSMHFASSGYLQDGCNDPNGWLWLDSSYQHVTIDFSTRELGSFPDDREYFRFIGKRIN